MAAVSEGVLRTAMTVAPSRPTTAVRGGITAMEPGWARGRVAGPCNDLSRQFKHPGTALPRLRSKRPGVELAFSSGRESGLTRKF